MKKAGKAPVKKTGKKVQDCPINCCSTAHKVWSAVALAGLFACGLILGLTYNQTDAVQAKMDAKQCDAIANEIVNITTNGATPENIDTLNELNQAYLDGCAGRLVVIEKPVAKSIASRPEIVSTCDRIEQLLQKRLYPEDNPEYWKHLANADTYSTLADRGCAENSEMYKTLALRELDIATALKPTESMGTRDAEIVIDTFKKLDMQQEAREFLGKVEKLIDPATDFILQMEQIINE